jgi:hypothetical protein
VRKRVQGPCRRQLRGSNERCQKNQSSDRSARRKESRRYLGWLKGPTLKHCQNKDPSAKQWRSYRKRHVQSHVKGKGVLTLTTQNREASMRTQPKTSKYRLCSCQVSLLELHISRQASNRSHGRTSRSSNKPSTSWKISKRMIPRPNQPGT